MRKILLIWILGILINIGLAVYFFVSASLIDVANTSFIFEFLGMFFLIFVNIGFTFIYGVIIAVIASQNKNVRNDIKAFFNVNGSNNIKEEKIHKNEENNNVNMCLTCGFVNKAKARFCIKCGTRLKKNSSN